MSDDKQQTSESGSSSASDSRSQAALDSASADRLTDGINSLTSKVDEAQRTASELGNRLYFLEREVRAANQQAVKDRQVFTALVERALRANREVAESEHQAIAGVVRSLDDTNKHLLLPRETDEQVIKRVVATRTVPWIIKHGTAIKIAIGIIAGIGAAVWAALRSLAHRI